MQTEKKMRRYFTNLPSTAFVLLASAGLSYGDTIIVSNITSTLNGTGTVYSSGPPQSYAQEFLTGNSSQVLGSIVVPLGSASGSFTAVADLFSNNNGLPGSTILTAFNVPQISTDSFANLTLTPTSKVTLNANTDYWFALSATGSNGSYQWQYTDTLSAGLPNYATSNDNGANWAIGTPPGPFLLQATATPEPSSLVLTAISLVGLGMLVSARRLRTSE